MIHLRNRKDLLDFIEANAPAPAIRRAMVYGSVELLGGFSPLPPNNSGGWIVKIITAHDKIYHVGVYTVGNKYVCKTISHVPWNKYVGLSTDPSGMLACGDNPKQNHMIKIAYGEVK